MVICICGILVLNTTKCQFSEAHAEEALAVGSTPYFNYFPATAYEVPHDVTISNPDSTQVDLARFAWQEFIALNWPSSYTPASPIRGTANQDKTVADFLNGSANYPLVWQTY
ncbi:MAG: hypothetical protein ACPF9D_12520, partial [Owenweeksia sp.]